MTTDGQHWTREQLATLRGGGYSPAAVGRFLLASQRRANQVRAARPELARQAQRWCAAGAVAWAAPLPSVRRRRRAGLLWWCACALMLDWHLGMVETEEGRPRPLGPADALTLARAWLVPLAWQRPDALTCALAGVCDVLDGPLARLGEPTRAGHDFDRIADVCFATASLRGAGRHGLLEGWAQGAETLWLAVGLASGLHAYFAQLEAPDRVLVHAARALVPARVSGRILAGAGQRRAGSALVGGGAALSAALAAGALARGARLAS
ncbi:MAG TPA: CDP-alcohol phosphatidyltransferase family protein [Solirubrobacteraceae bacterium]|jgi:phosphatidylglycerophosphate synthase|nr:CDP-alcohol phosphatidyltransferase family protein [Solirubrobacteraceae bacterium]